MEVRGEHRYGLYALQWIIEVNGQPTTDLETFIQAVKVCTMHQVANAPFVILQSFLAWLSLCCRSSILID